MNFHNIIERKKIIAIIRGYDVDTAIKIVTALHNGGINLIEVTFNQNSDNYASTIKTIEVINEKYPNIICGAGTVMTEEQLYLAHKAGAKYILAPDTDINIIKATKQLGLISIPGALTPTEASIAHKNGADYVKLFPISQLSCDYIKALKAPLSNIKFLAVGGINLDNAKNYLNAGAVGVGISNSLINSNLIQENNFIKITELARCYVKKIETN